MSPISRAAIPALLCRVRLSLTWPERSVQARASAYSGRDGRRADSVGLRRQARAEQHVVAELACSPDRILGQRARPLGLASPAVCPGQVGAGFDEQPVVAEPGGDLAGLLGQPEAGGQVRVHGNARGGDQSFGEQCGVGGGFGPPERRHEQPGRFLCPVARQPVPPQRDAEPQDLRGAVRLRRVPGGTAEVRLVGVQPREPAALVGPGQVRGRGSAADR